MPTTTTRLGLLQPIGADPVSEIRVAITNNATTLDNAVTWSEGTIGAIPAPGIAGRRYYATDVQTELYDTGTSWIPTSPGPPVGSISEYAGPSDPTDPDGVKRWLVCDGRAISRTTYSGLYTVVGITYGSGDGSSTFNLPDLRQRIPLGQKKPTGQKVRDDQTSSNGSVLGSSGGQLDHAHSVPGLSVPGLSIPNLTLSASVASHWHTLSTAGAADIGYEFVDPTHFSLHLGSQSTPFLSYRTAFAISMLEWTNDQGFPVAGVGLSGTTDGVGALPVNGTALGSTTGGGTTGGSATSANNQSYLTINYIIRAL